VTPFASFQALTWRIPIITHLPFYLSSIILFYTPAFGENNIKYLCPHITIIVASGPITLYECITNNGKN
jgi:hypothetical protein